MQVGGETVGQTVLSPKKGGTNNSQTDAAKEEML